MKRESNISFADLLLLVGLKTLTGELLIESGNSIGSVTVQDGKILHAFSPYSHAIGDILVDNGVITIDELLDTLQEQKQNAA